MQQYDPKIIEPKWQKYWDEVKPYHVEQDETKEKFFGMIEFPYPSGAGLHVGHPRPFTAMDVITRKKRMEGLNVLFPIGFDAFGLPTENYAIKTGRAPADVTAENIANFTRQLKMLGYGFDWDRAVDTTDPKYYKWTQWIFLQLFKHGLAYKKNMPINWCINCKIGLANEEVVDGRCERCGGPVEKRDKEQWMLAITKYADSLLEGLKDVDYIPQARTQQENWIGKSEGAEVIFTLRVPGQGEKHSVTVFTTRPDTLFGATFLAISAELAKKWMDMGWAASDEITSYIEKTITERVGTREEEPEKTGIDAGIIAINPVNGKEMPVWITNYVLGDVGTGAIMAVPAHDERDWDFAKKYSLPIVTVVAPSYTSNGDSTPREGVETLDRRVVDAVIENDEGQFLLIKETAGGVEHYHFVGGGTDGEEDVVAVKREVIEETGYIDFEIGEKVCGDIFCFGFRHTKNKNQKTVGPTFYVKITGNNKTSSEVEEGNHELIWVEKNKVKDLITWPHHVYIWESFLKQHETFTDDGKVVNSDFLNGLTTSEAKEKMIVWLEEKNIGKRQVNFKLRDWVFSRQRYWGEPIPLVFCEHCEKDGKRESKGEEMNPGWIPLSETELPLTLPMVEKYEPTDTGESPLATMTDWVRVKCPRCGGDARRETDTMPNWAGSSWYFLRYCDPNNDADFFAETDFRFKPEIDVTPKDLAYIDAFKKMYSDLNKKDVRIFAANRFLLNGLNGRLWLPLKTISVMFWKKDEPTIFDYLKTSGYVLEKEDKGGHVFTNGDIKVEIIPVIEEGGRIFSYTPQGNTADMSYNDFPLMEGAHLHGFWYRTVSPEYNLKHYKFVQEHEAPDRTGLGDDEKIEFLEKYTKCLNPALRYWTPVDWYNGGMEHTVLHLLYSRFWNQFLFDIGVVPTKEPYKKRTSHGMILAKGGEKMSKSKGNVVNPDDMVEQFGADALRAYIMFMGPFDQAVEWDVNGLVGVRRFLDRVWSLQAKLGNASSEATDKILHQTVKKVTEDIDAMRFNTAIAKMMELVNAFHKEESLSKDQLGILVRLLAPFAPHMTEDLWQDVLGNKGSVGRATWPGYDEGKLVNDTCMLAVQVNGKVRGDIEVAADISDEDAKTQAMAHHNVQKWLEGKEPKKVIYVKGKLVSIVV